MKMKKSKIVIIVLLVVAAIYYLATKPSSKYSSDKSSTIENTLTASPNITTKPTQKQSSYQTTPTPTSTANSVPRGDYRDNYNAIAKYPMSVLKDNTRSFRRTSDAGGCYIEFNNYRNTTGYYEIVVNAKSQKEEDAPVFIQVCQDMIVSIDPSISKDTLNIIVSHIKSEESLEDYSIGNLISITYHGPISWSSGYLSIKIY